MSDRAKSIKWVLRYAQNHWHLSPQDLGLRKTQKNPPVNLPNFAHEQLCTLCFSFFILPGFWNWRRFMTSWRRWPIWPPTLCNWRWTIWDLWLPRDAGRYGPSYHATEGKLFEIYDFLETLADMAPHIMQLKVNYLRFMTSLRRWPIWPLTSCN